MKINMNRPCHYEMVEHDRKGNYVLTYYFTRKPLDALAHFHDLQRVGRRIGNSCRLQKVSFRP